MIIEIRIANKNLAYVQEREKRFACFAKQQPGRARQKFLAAM